MTYACRENYYWSVTLSVRGSGRRQSECRWKPVQTLHLNARGIALVGSRGPKRRHRLIRHFNQLICSKIRITSTQTYYLCYCLLSATIKPRHKSHLIFQFTESQTSNNVVAKAELNVFVHSRSFLRAREMRLPENLGFIDIEIAKVLHGSHKIVFDTIRNVSLPDAGSDGEFKQLNITQMVAEWFSSYETSHGLAIKIYSSVTGDPLPHKIVALDAENLATVSLIGF